MNRFKILQRLTLFTLIYTLSFLPLSVVRGQDSQTITAEGTLTGNGISIPFTMEFPPAGGPVTGTIDYSGEATNGGARCPGTLIVAISGNFAGGDGSVANGGFEGTEQVTCADKSIGSITITYHPGGIIDGAIIGSGWTGYFYANGTGSGTMRFRATAWDLGDTVTWQVIFSAAEFQAALPVQITSEYIFTKYGIRVEDSFGGDGWDPSSWSDHELVLLNDVLKNLPPGFLEQITLNRIVRNKVKYNPDGTPRPGRAGEYRSCDIATDPDCNGSSSTLRIFDGAANPWLNNDPDTSFKAVILHEITHAYQYHKDKSSIYEKATNSPQVQDYMEATKPINFEGSSSLLNGWDWSDPPGKWEFWSPDTNQPPLEYGKKNPLEDMSVSVSYYVYAPEELKKTSPERYNYIRDYIYGGVEYENGHPIQP
ncbi:MAG: hypothetical protein D4R46_01175 [Chloroflexi bacterium]|nr:MAG: hypothetical protein D4R46_01175 [Chloroflexota bacterium]